MKIKEFKGFIKIGEEGKMIQYNFDKNKPSKECNWEEEIFENEPILLYNGRMGNWKEVLYFALLYKNELYICSHDWKLGDDYIEAFPYTNEDNEDELKVFVGEEMAKKCLKWATSSSNA